jgi:hypothetical protein
LKILHHQRSERSVACSFVSGLKLCSVKSVDRSESLRELRTLHATASFHASPADFDESAEGSKES